MRVNRWKVNVNQKMSVNRQKVNVNLEDAR